jgi:hypothetical protein
MIIYTDNQADNGTPTSDQATINYPASNIKDSRLSRIFKGSENTELLINAGGELKNISQAYTNLIQDPNDLSTVNWSLLNGATAVISTESYQGFLMTKIGSTDSIIDPQVQQSNLNVTASVKHNYSIVLRNLNYSASETITFFALLAGETNQLNINLVNKTVVQVLGDSFKYNFVDDDTVVITAITAGTSADTTLTFRIDPDQTGDSTKFFYVTAAQLVDNTTSYYPFINGSKIADVISESFILPFRFIFDIIITPFFRYDTLDSNNRFFQFGSGFNRMFLFYEEGSNQIQLTWLDGGAARLLSSLSFDDGTSLTNLNQRLRIVGSIDLFSGEIDNSRLMIIPLEEGNFYEDNQWNGIPDIKITNFDTIFIGVDATSTSQSDSEFEYIRFYEGLLSGSINNSDDVDELLKDKKVLFDQTYQSKITATDLLIGGNTINDGDVVLLRANDVDSFNAGTPLDEVVTWSEDIIKHNFTKGSYQYYWLSVNSSNVVDIGRLYLGTAYTTPDISPTITHDKISTSIRSRSVSGQTYMDRGYFYEMINTTYPAATHEEKAELFEIFETIDIGVPFFVTFDESCSDLGTLYVTLEENELRATLLSNPDYYTIGITLREEV